MTTSRPKPLARPPVRGRDSPHAANAPGTATRLWRHFVAIGSLRVVDALRMVLRIPHPTNRSPRDDREDRQVRAAERRLEAYCDAEERRRRKAIAASPKRGVAARARQDLQWRLHCPGLQVEESRLDSNEFDRLFEPPDTTAVARGESRDPVRPGARDGARGSRRKPT